MSLKAAALKVLERNRSRNFGETQNATQCNFNATCDDISCGHADNKESSLLEALADACRSHDITPTEVERALSLEDIEDCRKGAINADTLATFARSLVQRREMDKGKRPAHYTEQATCRHCGPIWLWFTGEVLGCPWCWNRVADKPIPRPYSVHCGDCIHFERNDHPNLGHCAKGEQEAIAGLWDTDRRYCEHWLPLHQKTGAKNLGN